MIVQKNINIKSYCYRYRKSDKYFNVKINTLSDKTKISMYKWIDDSFVTTNEKDILSA